MNSKNIDIKLEEKRLYNEYKKNLLKLTKVKSEQAAVGQVFTKGLLPLYVLYILSLGPSNGNDIAHKIGERTVGQWVPSTGGIYPILTKLEKGNYITGSWDNPSKRVQKIYTLTEEGLIEFNHKKHLLKPKIQEALNVFKIVFMDLYD
ncbi:MAG: PadR family transcriptional regulator [Clostridiaceae bacterium]|nr:PadR family transcriptional regulator [Clostridiaceae bacterium]